MEKWKKVTDPMQLCIAKQVILTFLFYQRNVDRHKWPSCSSARVEDVLTDTSWNTSQRSCDQTERSTSLHHGTRTSRTQR